MPYSGPPIWNARNNVVLKQDTSHPPVQFDYSGATFQTNYVMDAGGKPEPQLEGYKGIALHIARIWNPKIKTFKGLKNSGGLNNNDNMYLPRFARYAPRRTASGASVQLFGAMRTVTAAAPIRSVFVPAAELR